MSIRSSACDAIYQPNESIALLKKIIDTDFNTHRLIVYDIAFNTSETERINNPHQPNMIAMQEIAKKPCIVKFNSQKEYLPTTVKLYVPKKRIKSKNIQLIDKMDEAINNRIHAINGITCCQKKFNTYEEIVYHFKQTHKNNENLKCPYNFCGTQGFINHRKLVDHYVQTHYKINIFSCLAKNCKKQYNNRSSLLNHLKKCRQCIVINTADSTDHHALLLPGQEDDIQIQQNINNRNFFEQIEELLPSNGSNEFTLHDDFQEYRLVNESPPTISTNQDESFFTDTQISQNTNTREKEKVNRQDLIKTIDHVIDQRLNKRNGIACCDSTNLFYSRKDLMRHFEDCHLYNGEFRCPYQNCEHDYISDSQTIVDHYLNHYDSDIFCCIYTLCFCRHKTRRDLLKHTTKCREKTEFFSDQC